MPRNLGTKGFGTHFYIPSSYWMGTAPGVQGTATLTLSTLFAVPVVFYRNGTINGVGLNVTTAGASSNVLRFGLYDSDGGLPGARVADWGTVSSTTTGMKTITGLSTAVVNDLYFICVASQVGTACVGRTGTSHNCLVGQSASTPADQVNCSYTMTGQTGALSSTFTIAATSAVGPQILFRYA